MPFFHFPCDYVYWTHVEDHENIKAKYLPKVREAEKKHKGNTQGLIGEAVTGYTEDDNLTDELNKFIREPDITNSVVWNSINKLLKDNIEDKNMWKFRFTESYIKVAWYTSYDANVYFPLHTHDDGEPMFRNGMTYYPSFSMIYILNDENERNSTVFKTFENPRSLCARKEITFNTGNIPDIKEGSVLIFPAHLPHYVIQAMKPGRVTIAYNLYSTYD